MPFRAGRPKRWFQPPPQRCPVSGEAIQQGMVETAAIHRLPADIPQGLGEQIERRLVRLRSIVPELALLEKLRRHITEAGNPEAQRRHLVTPTLHADETDIRRVL